MSKEDILIKSVIVGGMIGGIVATSFFGSVLSILVGCVAGMLFYYWLVNKI